MKTIPFYGHGWEANSYLIIDNNEAALIDAGVPSKIVTEALEEENAKLKYILLTHGHFDHTVSVDALRESTGAKLAVHGEDEEMLSDAEKSALALFFGRYDKIKPCDISLKGGDKIELGSTEITVMHTPGHSKGSVCFLVGDSLFTGDTLFDGGYGRYDLHGGDFNKLCASLSSLKSLDRKLEIHPGHGGSAKLGDALDCLNFI